MTVKNVTDQKIRTRTAHRTCPLCEAGCALRLDLDDDGRVLRVAGDERDPLSKGYICPKGAVLGKVDEDPDRLRRPLLRQEGEWREVGWDEAFAAVEAGLSEVIGTHGRDAVALYFGNPTFHTIAAYLYRQAITQALGSKNVYSASTADQMPKQVACGLMFGDAMAIGVPDLDHTGHLLILGANPVESNGSLCAAPDFAGRLKALRRRGGKVVVVDPRRTRTAALADEHLSVRPGTDPLLLMAMVHTVLDENLERIGLPVSGLEQLRELAHDFPPEAVGPVCGIAPETIVRTARELAAAPSAAVYARIGTCTTPFGTVAQWLVDVLNTLTGNLDRRGGVMFAETAALEIFRAGPAFSTGKWHSRVRGLPEVLGEFPVATLADEIETPGEEQVRALVTIAGNPASSAPNAPRLARAIEGLDFVVCVDPYLNETTRLADVILPPPRTLQSPHFDFLVQIIMVRNYARYSRAILPLDDDQRSEAEILARLMLIAAGLGVGTEPTRAEEMFLDQLGITGEAVDALDGEDGTEKIVDALLRAGGYGLSLKALLDAPHGLDLGPLQPRLPALLRTPDNRVDLAPPQLVAEAQRLRACLDGEPPEFLLIGRRHLRSNNSWLHNVEELRGGTNLCTLQIHPADAARLGLDATTPAVIGSAVGELTVPIEVTDTIMPGVVSLPHGWGHQDSPQRVARRDPGVNTNILTDDAVLDGVSGTAVFNAVPVTVRAAPQG
ncbi:MULTISPECIES: molybdopterin-dependent oxidoreductase [Streptomyces]|uniref:molybdopterin-dependent oxidoreductase n=1 Tax=Streptomyces TaxID=1883 RepID=UPI000B1CBD5F|nr:MULTISPECIES: molybdopterin-dependent oxidoreductase [Streptomyces]